MNIHPKRTSAGFTLVEMLVVIAIIAILVGLVSVAAVNAVNKAKQVRIKSELDQLDMAIKAFKAQYGAYPPANLTTGNQAAVAAFVLQAWPRYYSPTPTQIMADIHTAGIDTSNFRPDAALVFWLQGLNPDVTHPFFGVPTTNATAGTPVFTTTTYTPMPLFNFDQTRLKVVAASGSGAIADFVYVPINQTSPYVYFDANGYGVLPVTGTGPSGSGATGTPPQFYASNTDGSAGGIATPYVLDVTNIGAYNVPGDTFCNPTSFQIISAGQDNSFGNFPNLSQFRLYPAGVGYDTTGLENDNVTNFTDRSSLGDALPN